MKKKGNEGGFVFGDALRWPVPGLYREGGYSLGKRNRGCSRVLHDMLRSCLAIQKIRPRNGLSKVTRFNRGRETVTWKDP